MQGTMKRIVALALVLVLALAAVVRFRGHDERAWSARRGELRGLALTPSTLRRPWEVRLQSLQERLHAAPRFDEIAGSPHRPVVVLGEGEPRALDELERVWVEGLWNELFGLDAVLSDLRALALDDLSWNGESTRLSFVRECTLALCARAWLALEGGDPAGATLAYADALRFARATDDGTSLALLARVACEQMVLDSVRTALSLGLPARAALDGLAPLLTDWSFAPEAAEARIRRDLSGLVDEDGRWHDATFALDWFAPVEAALALAEEPAAAVAEHGPSRSDADERERRWTLAIEHLHARHARRNVALTALSVAAFREEHGALPATLDALPVETRAAALDPLTGEPLPYARSADGARIGPAAWGQRVEGRNDDERSPYAWRVR